MVISFFLSDFVTDVSLKTVRLPFGGNVITIKLDNKSVMPVIHPRHWRSFINYIVPYTVYIYIY